MVNFTQKQRAIIAKKLGYDGPMEQFDAFLKSDPALEMKYNMVADKYTQKMNRGGVVSKKKNYAEGGAVPDQQQSLPPAPEPAKVEPALITEQPGQIISTVPAPNKATTTTTTQASTTQAAIPTVAPAQTTQAATVSEQADKTLQDVNAQQGTLSKQAIVAPAQGSLSEGAKATAVEGKSIDVVAPEERKVQEGELISGPSVDMGQVESTLAQGQAAQGTVTEEMTVQGQMNKLMSDFNAGNPPPWAAAAMRAVTDQMAARGLGASSIAGQAMVQAALESAMPMAAADAQTFKEMGFANLSNKQAMAMQTAQLRAQFLGQSFDQSFQTKVLNASKISEIADINFSAQQTIALENARAANTVNLANLTNKQAVILANAAAQAQMDVANLNNRQQAAVMNAQAFLQMDMTNLNNRQQTMMFKTQERMQALFSDQAAENATRQFNASSVNQRDQFMASLVSQANQFNASQKNATSQFNAGQRNAVNQFNAEVQNRRSEFNAQNRLVIDQANAQWRREISTANTASINAANYLNAQNLQSVTMAEYNNKMQLYRDNMNYAFTSGENAAQRAANLAIAQMQNSVSNKQLKYETYATVGNWLSKVDDWGSVLSGAWGAVEKGWDWVTTLGD